MTRPASLALARPKRYSCCEPGVATAHAIRVPLRANQGGTMRDEIEAGLRAFAETIETTAVDADRIDLALELCGTALRLEVPVDKSIRRWIEGLLVAEFTEALDRAAAPFGNELPTKLDEFFEAAVQHRDRVESVVVAVRRVRRGNTWSTPGFAELDEAMVRFDAHVRFWFGSNEITRALGPRTAMLWDGHWATKKVVRCL